MISTQLLQDYKEREAEAIKNHTPETSRNKKGKPRKGAKAITQANAHHLKNVPLKKK